MKITEQKLVSRSFIARETITAPNPPVDFIKLPSGILGKFKIEPDIGFAFLFTSYYQMTIGDRILEDGKTFSSNLNYVKETVIQPRVHNSIYATNDFNLCFIFLVRLSEYADFSNSAYFYIPVNWINGNVIHNMTNFSNNFLKLAGNFLYMRFYAPVGDLKGFVASKQIANPLNMWDFDINVIQTGF